MPSARTAIIVHVTVIDTGVTEQNGTLTAQATGAQYQWLDCNAGLAPASARTDRASSRHGTLGGAGHRGGLCGHERLCAGGEHGHQQHRPARIARASEPHAGPLLRVQLRSSTSSPERLTLYDAAGRSVLEARTDASSVALFDLSALAPAFMSYAPRMAPRPASCVSEQARASMRSWTPSPGA